MALVFSTLYRRRLKLVEERIAFRARPFSREDIRCYQRDCFNEVWREACRRYRFYADWRDAHHLPDAISDIDEVKDFPMLQKADVQRELENIARDAAPCSFILTGGSTGTPGKFPVTRQDNELSYANSYLCKSWSGIAPEDPIILLWGHGHLFGTGLKGYLNLGKRAAIDWVANVRRLNAYRLDEPSLARYVDIIGRNPGAVLVGYASVIRKLAHFIEAGGTAVPELRAKAVILSSETIFPSDLELVSRVFSAPAIMEYGMAEVGVIGTSTAHDDRVSMLWDAYYCHVADGGELAFSSLQSRRFPLINYAPGDRVDPDLDGKDGGLRCRRILGRANDLIQLTRRDGTLFEAHALLFIHIVIGLPGVESFCVGQKGQAITVSLKCRRPLDELKRAFEIEIRKEFPDLDTSFIALAPLDVEPRTPAGKARYIVRE